MEFVVIFFILIVFAAAVVFIVRRGKIVGKGKRLSEMVKTAYSEFESISNYGRQTSEKELIEYKTKYRGLYEDIRNFRFAEMMSQKLYDSFGIGDYVTFYVDIENLCRENNRINNEIGQLDKWCGDIAAELALLFDENHYFAFSELNSILQHNTFRIESFRKLFSSYSEYFSNPKAGELYQFVTSPEDSRKRHNKTFEEKQIALNEDYFDNVLSYPLDKQQREAVVCLEDNTLVISSAGSGKTSTIIGKAKYLLDIRKIDPSKLLIVTYTRKAASELHKRLGAEDVDCCTFHSLALRIISQAEGKKPTICSASLLFNVFGSLIKNDRHFLSGVLHYLLHLHSLMKLEHDYSKAPEYFADRKKYGIQAPYTDMYNRVIFTRSEEEKRLCTYLTELGVDFVYEQPYQYDTSTKDHRRYLPDFTIYVKDKTINPETGKAIERTRLVYLEHFAIDKNGNVPEWFGDKDPRGGWYAQNRKYKDGIKWKRETHKLHNTTLISTTSADFHSGRILEVLKVQLSKACVPYREVSAEELYKRLVRRSPNFERSVFALLERFVALVKSNCPENDPLVPLLKNAAEKKDVRTQTIISDIILPLYKAYSAELKKLGQIDFTDAINLATGYCAMDKWKEYDYILVDEFQDISADRYHFLQCLRRNSPFTKMFCVGDDWQSIYRFAGSNMRLFYKFEEYFGFTEYRKIETTYRFCNPLLDLSSDFIQRNPEQVKKNVVPFVSPMPLTGNDGSLPVRQRTVDGVICRYHDGEEPLIQKWVRSNHTYIDFLGCSPALGGTDDLILKSVQDLVRSIPETESILILGRYNYDVCSLGYSLSSTTQNTSSDKMFVTIEGRRIRFLSVHSAKGLEADNVILINCEEGQNGFPSLIEDDPILGYVLSEEDQFEYAEERRLFYVAITRAKRHTYVLFHSDKPSPFVRELTSVVSAKDNICPLCQQGTVVVIKEGISKYGAKYINYGCSNYSSGCDFFERVFAGSIPNFVNFNEKLKKGSVGRHTGNMK